MKDLSVAYPSQSTAPSTDYPYGGAKDVSTSGDNTGTPRDAVLQNDHQGFYQALVETAGITPSNVSETAVDSQLLKSVQTVIDLINMRHTNSPNLAQSLNDRIGGIHTDDISAPYSTQNQVSTAYTYINCWRGWNVANNRESMFAIRSGVSSSIYEFTNKMSDFSVETTQRNITLPANTTPDSGCCDGSHVYLLCHTAATGTACAVYKFSINPWSATPVWSSTLTGAIEGTNRDGGTVIKVVDDSRIAVLFNGAALDTGVPALAVLLKSTGAATYGSGNHVASSSRYGGIGMCVAAGSIWFTTRTSGFESSWLNGAQITSPASAPASQPNAINISGSFGQIESNGRLIVVPMTVVGVVSVNILDTGGGTTMNASESYYNFLNATLDDDYPVVAFDGCRFWTLWNESSHGLNSFLVPVDLDEYDSAYAGSSTIPRPYVFIEASSATAPTDKSRICYADGCLWLIPDNTANGMVRVPRLATRY
jgi:hypothetical protein